MKKNYHLIKKRYPLRTPTVRNKKTEGWLEILHREPSKNFTIQWNFGSMDWLAVNESYLFPQLLESHPWQDELRQRLNDEGWHLDRDCRFNMKWETVRPVSEGLALWVAETLPPLFALTTEFFETRFPDGIDLFFKGSETEKVWNTAMTDFAIQYGSLIS
jgi:hypothetical protein